MFDGTGRVEKPVSCADSGEVDQGSGLKAISIPAIPIR